ncbi:lactonase family protein [Paraburkholderia sp. DHOC27]|uniref:lactonase family protein n=1 Tax=Paraburkholderia sp. DHOC27 TaxID=2303330 RepID=UPI000E3E3F43|nr:lactonase family protein [Paraburkholderia sp. DHOC27]RFU47621.1 lactonase family protein [Paraburkholderia sp. DHOC27]
MTGATLVFVGGLNQDVPHFDAAHGKGISVFAFDEQTGKLTWLSDTTAVPNPTYLTVVPGRRMLYATSEMYGREEGWISAFRIDPASGTLSEVGSRQSTRGSLSAHCNTDREGRCAMVANYSHETVGELPGKHVVSFALQPDGSLTPAVSEAVHTGKGPRADRQGVPHPHCVMPSPDNRFVLVPDLGTDQIVTYRLDAASGRLERTQHEALQMAPGSGPRHLAFHPDGTKAYVINELSNTVCALGYDAAHGTLRLLQTFDGLAADAPLSYGAGLLVSADGRFLYATFRGDDSVMTYALDSRDGTLSGATRHASGGKTPRSFAMTPSGAFMLVANQDSDVLVSWRLDPVSGAPVEQADTVAVGTPMCVQAVTFA